MFKKKKERRNAQEILKLAGVLDDVDDDVSALCIKLMPEDGEHLISMGDLMSGVQEIKNKLIAEQIKVFDDFMKNNTQRIVAKGTSEILLVVEKKDLLKLKKELFGDE